jgi:hypothetical protein
MIKKIPKPRTIIPASGERVNVPVSPKAGKSDNGIRAKV